MCGNGSDVQGKRVLVVDDEHSLRLLVRVNLELDGHVVHDAANLGQAREVLERRPIDVVLLDIHVGSEDGLELLDEIRALELPTRVILLSGSAEVGPDLRARVDGVLGKPFALDRLNDAVVGGAVR
jgi:DNA-binding NtrC family response regulator